MRTILVYGDSNTYGTVPLSGFGDGKRFDLETRWAGVMRTELGAGHWVIEEGLGGRTTVHDDPIEGAHKNGRTYLLPCLESHAPVDLVIIKLGTNDLKRRFGLGAADIAAGAGVLLDIVASQLNSASGVPPRALLIAPAPVARLDLFAEMFEGASETSKGLGRQFAAVAKGRGTAFLNAGDHVVSSDIDGIHLDADQHRRLGAIVAAKVRDLLGG